MCRVHVCVKCKYIIVCHIPIQLIIQAHCRGTLAYISCNMTFGGQFIYLKVFLLFISLLDYIYRHVRCRGQIPTCMSISAGALYSLLVVGITGGWLCACKYQTYLDQHPVCLHSRILQVSNGIAGVHASQLECGIR